MGVCSQFLWLVLREIAQRVIEDLANAAPAEAASAAVTAVAVMAVVIVEVTAAETATVAATETATSSLLKRNDPAEGRVISFFCLLRRHEMREVRRWNKVATSGNR